MILAHRRDGFSYKVSLVSHLPVFILVLLTGTGLFAGLVIGILIMDRPTRRAAKTLICSFVRYNQKKWKRLDLPVVDIGKVQQDEEFAFLNVDEKLKRADVNAIAAARELKQHLCNKFGSNVEAVYLFGSRVRGDYQPDSDVDVGIFVCDADLDFARFEQEVFRQTTLLLLKYGLYFQPRILKSKPNQASYLVWVIQNSGLPA